MKIGVRKVLRWILSFGCVLVVGVVLFAMVASDGWKASAMETVWRVARPVVLVFKGRSDLALHRLPDIKFHGLVQNSRTGEGIANLPVELRWEDFSLSGRSSRTVTTDEHGRFELEGVIAGYLFVDLKKPRGYDVLDGNPVAFFSTNSSVVLPPARNSPALPFPSNDKPAVFKLQPIVTNDRVVSGFGTADSPKQPRGHAFTFTADSGPIRFRFNDPKFEGRTDGLEVIIEATREAYIDGKEGWKCRISVPDGGLVQVHDRFDFVAPETGYAEELSLSIDRNWAKLFFFGKNREGTYFRLATFLNPIRGHNALAELSVDLDGSRNLDGRHSAQ